MTVDFSFFIRRARRHVFLILFAILWPGAAGNVFASQSVELTWGESTSPNIVYYKVYFGTHSHQYTDSTKFGVGTVDVTIPGLASGVTYYFAVTAIDDQNRESVFSNEAVYNVPLPGTLSLQVQGTTAALRAVDATWSWAGSVDSDISGYAVKYGTQSGVYTDTATFYGTLEGIIPNLPGGTIYFRVFPIDSYGIQPVGSPEASFQMPAVVPLGLQAHVPTGSSGVELTWNAIADQGVAGYNLHFGTSSHSYAYVQNCGNLNDYILHGLAAGQTYYFVVSPVDVFGNEGQYSSEVTCVAPAPFPLGAQVHGSTAALQAVDLSWTPSPDPDVNGYVVYYGTQTNTYDGSLFVYGTTNELLYGLAGGATNYFAVAPVDSFGVEPVATRTLAVFVPATPNLVLNAQPTNAYTVHLNWNLIPNEGVVAYNVYFGSQSGAYDYGNGYGTVNEVDIDGLAPGNTYYFAIRAVDYYGNETKISNEAMVVTPPPPGMLLQTQTYADGSGRPYLMEITTPAVVTGPWELDSSPDLKTWTLVTNGIGPGYGDGYDVDAFVGINSTKPKMFFRVKTN